MSVVLRAFIATADVAEATLVQGVITEVMSMHGSTTASEPKPYWKIPTYMEVVVETHLDGEIKPAFESVLAALGSGWDVRRFDSGGDWAVWNPSSASSFIDGRVRWANLETLT